MPDAAPAEIRPAENGDLGAILAIHNRAIRESLAIWSEAEVAPSERRRWLDEHRMAGHPVLVAVVDGTVAGFAAYGQWRPRTGYRFCVENSVYLADEYHRRGIGRQLMLELIRLAKANGMHVMMAGIEAGNTASIALHRELGFDEPVILRQVGYKFDQWLDLALMRLDLTAPH